MEDREVIITPTFFRNVHKGARDPDSDPLFYRIRMTQKDGIRIQCTVPIVTDCYGAVCRVPLG